MTTRDFRVTVRGFFDRPSDEQRAALLADAAAHDVFSSAFTREGHMSYELAMRDAFTFRFLDSGEAEEDVLFAEERAEAAVLAWLSARGLRAKNQRTTSEDLSQAALSKRQRRAAAQ